MSKETSIIEKIQIIGLIAVIIAATIGSVTIIAAKIKLALIFLGVL